METIRELRIEVNRLTTITVPAGTEVEAVLSGERGGFSFAIKDPLRFIPVEDAIARSDAEHHYLWVHPDDVLKTFKEFARVHGITIASARRPLADEKDHIAYDVEIKRGRDKFTTDFRMGKALKGGPSVDDVLQCLASDARVREHDTFESFADESGYDPDSRKHERIYRACIDQTDQLEAFLGQDLLADLLLCEEEL